ncbi:MAG TPA: WhiB family transcriptional regulator [Plantibacter sp.]|uniref:WhiB family transcriptional regulator n=1 Tax=Plantibacter sp. TaxID=1871045 RepID=UPI002C463B86|nr:WhiB family transcriptional regulator [Plantibacter sp.]
MTQEVTVPEFHPEPWVSQAACRTLDTRMFFPEQGKPAGPAKAVCRGCEVREECLAFAMRGPERFGIFGGLSEKERRRIRIGMRAAT